MMGKHHSFCRLTKNKNQSRAESLRLIFLLSDYIRQIIYYCRRNLGLIH